MSPVRKDSKRPFLSLTTSSNDEENPSSVCPGFGGRTAQPPRLPSSSQTLANNKEDIRLIRKFKKASQGKQYIEKAKTLPLNSLPLARLPLAPRDALALHLAPSAVRLRPGLVLLPHIPTKTKYNQSIKQTEEVDGGRTYEALLPRNIRNTMRRMRKLQKAITSWRARIGRNIWYLLVKPDPISPQHKKKEGEREGETHRTHGAMYNPSLGENLRAASGMRSNWVQTE